MIICIISSIFNLVHPVLWQHYPLCWKCALLRREEFSLCCWVGRSALHMSARFLDLSLIGSHSPFPVQLFPQLLKMGPCETQVTLHPLLPVSPAPVHGAALSFGGVEYVATFQALGVFHGVFSCVILLVFIHGPPSGPVLLLHNKTVILYQVNYSFSDTVCVIIYYGQLTHTNKNTYSRHCNSQIMEGLSYSIYLCRKLLFLS